jgi:hypothetical protein
VFAVPPHATWFRGAAVGALSRSDRLARFWAQARRVLATRANGQLARAFYVGDEGVYRPHSLQVVDFDGERVAPAVHLIGPDDLRGFDVPERIA